MARLTEYRPLIKRLIGDYLEFLGDDHKVDVIQIIDEDSDNYLLLEVGWQHPRRIYSPVFHVRFKGGKIWVEQDWTREGVAAQLIEAGVPEALIEYGYQEPELRVYQRPTAI